VCATALIAGCAPAAEPTPTKTAAFASEDEAFAAAEKTYRAYVDALNNVDLADPATFEGLYRWETGEALATDKKAFTQMHADGWSMDGTTELALIEPADYESGSSLQMDACVDVGAVTLVDDQGMSMVAADRGDIQALVIRFDPSESTETGWRISQVSGRDGGPQCDS